MQKNNFWFWPWILITTIFFQCFFCWLQTNRNIKLSKHPEGYKVVDTTHMCCLCFSFIWFWPNNFLSPSSSSWWYTGLGSLSLTTIITPNHPLTMRIINDDDGGGGEKKAREIFFYCATLACNLCVNGLGNCCCCCNNIQFLFVNAIVWTCCCYKRLATKKRAKIFYSLNTVCLFIFPIIIISNVCLEWWIFEIFQFSPPLLLQ